jgi:PAS domain S-box-containing protein
MVRSQDSPAAALRLRAKERLSDRQKSRRPGAGDPGTATDAVRLVHELQVHQIELEMQNEELQQERARADALLARYTDLYDLAPAGYLTLDREGTIRQVNLTGARLLGVERSRLVNGRLGQFVAECERRSFSDFLEKVFASAAMEACDVTLSREEPSTLVVRIEATRSADGQECLAVLLDITERERAEAERARLEDELRQAQKMDAVGRLAGGVAHDFNNMLAVILGNAQLVMTQVGSTHPIHAELTEIHEAATRSAGLTRQLLGFARKQTIVPTVLELNDTVANMLTMIRRLIGENIQLAWQPGAALWPVKLDPSQLDQLLVNLCVNARDAIGDAGQVTIETGNCVIGEDYCAAHVGCVPGPHVRLTVRDDGRGLDKHTQLRLFEPFFTTKALGQGTGLGLATVYGIVKQNHGYIAADSEPNQGTTITIYLPRHMGDAGPARTGDVARPVPRGDETILLVEDEPGILKLTRRMLQGQGYTVLAAHTPAEAASLATKHAGPIHLLLTDVVMPGMNGRVLAGNLLALRPQLKRLFMSGYTADVIADQGVLDEGVHFLQKPFTVEDLATKVRDALDAHE